MEHPTKLNEPTAAPHQTIQGPQPLSNDRRSIHRPAAGFEVSVGEDRIRSYTRWTVAARFEDRAIALLEAGRLDATLRYYGVRILEEAIDETTGEIFNRIVFHSANANPGGTPIPSRRTGAFDSKSPVRSSQWSWAGLRFITGRPEARALAAVTMVSGIVAGIVLKSMA